MSMTTTQPPTPPEPESAESILRRTTSRGRRVRNGMATGWMVVSVVIAIIPLLFVFGYVLQKGLKMISVNWFTKDLPIIDQLPTGGMKAAIIGTLLITAWASLMAIP